MSFNCYNDIRASMHECQIYGFNLQNSTGGTWQLKPALYSFLRPNISIHQISRMESHIKFMLPEVLDFNGIPA